MELLLNRRIKQSILDSLVPQKVVVLVGPRRVGKTVLIEQLIKAVNLPYLLLNGEDITTHEVLDRRSAEHYRQLLEGRSLLIIDEAQKIPDIGQKLKLMIDEIKGLHILITGSSAFDIANKTGEPLTGRKVTFRLFALSEDEYTQVQPMLIRKDKLHERLVYGNYPELLHIASTKQKNTYLNDLVQSYLLKDILAFENLRNADRIIGLLRLLAYQIGAEVSTSELGNQLQISSNTVKKYLDLLSKVYIIHRLDGFSRNLRKEVTKSSRWYFLDNGIRNILIANLHPTTLRNDIGQLWENYMIAERLKYQHYEAMIVNNYFWRTYDQQEIDWIEDRGGRLHAYEFKWQERKTRKAPAGWRRNYPNATYTVIHQNNYQDWLLDR